MSSEKLKTILEFLKYIRPKAYNAITRLLVIGGLGLISPPLITQLINLITKESFSFNIINENDPYFGITLIICALIYNIYASKTHISKRIVSLILEFEDNKIYLSNEGSISVELFQVLLEIYEIFEKTEFRDEEKIMLNVERLLKPEQKATLFELSNQIKTVFDRFNMKIQPNDPSLPPLPFGLNLYVHYNIVGTQKRKRIDFERWIIKSSKGDYIIYKDAAFYDRNLSISQKMKYKLIESVKWIISPIDQYKKYRKYKYAQKKLDFESIIRALYKQKISEKEAVSRVVNLVGKKPKDREILKEYIVSRGLDQFLTVSIKKVFD